MHPTLITIGSLVISSFGLFLSLAFVAAVFSVWRLSRVYDINEEKTIDVTLLTFFGGLIGSRLFFVLGNLNEFNTFSRILLINKYPGLQFWGGVIFGVLTLYVFTRRLKLGFYHMADFITVGFFAALIFGSLGCLLGTCQYGFPYSGIFSVPQIGLVGSRFPIQFLEAIVYFLLFASLWKMCLRFHYSGKVVGAGLAFLGLTKFIAEFFRGDSLKIFLGLGEGQFFGIISFVLGTYIFYKQSKRSLSADVKYFLSIFTNPVVRKTALSKTSRSWYNLKVSNKVSVKKLKKNAVSSLKGVLQNLNVKTKTPRIP